MTRYLPCGLLSLSGLTALLLPRCSTRCFGRVYAELFIQPCPCLLAADASVFALEQTIPSSSLPGLQRFVFSGPYQDTAKFPKGDFSSSSFKRSQQRSRCPISYSSLTHAGCRSSFSLVSPQVSSATRKAEVPLCLEVHGAGRGKSRKLCQGAGTHQNMPGHVPGALHLY